MLSVKWYPPGWPCFPSHTVFVRVNICNTLQNLKRRCYKKNICLSLIQNRLNEGRGVKHTFWTLALDQTRIPKGRDLQMPTSFCHIWRYNEISHWLLRPRKPQIFLSSLLSGMTTCYRKTSETFSRLWGFLGNQKLDFPKLGVVKAVRHAYSKEISQGDMLRKSMRRVSKYLWNDEAKWR